MVVVGILCAEVLVTCGTMAGCRGILFCQLCEEATTIYLSYFLPSNLDNAIACQNRSYIYSHLILKMALLVEIFDMPDQE